MLKGIQLQYTSADGYTTMISTDYVIMLPEINWTLDTASPDPAASPTPAATVNEIDLSECVQYADWIKK
jgi:hypothetical protein